jgi:MSHA type pilus biogenesis protein MshL
MKTKLAKQTPATGHSLPGGVIRWAAVGVLIWSASAVADPTNSVPPASASAPVFTFRPVHASTNSVTPAPAGPVTLVTVTPAAPTPAPGGEPAAKAVTDTNSWESLVAPVSPAVRPVFGSVQVSLVPAPVPAVNPGLEQHTQGKIIEKFHADNLDLKAALALFASQNNLNIVPDNDLSGTVTLDVHNLPLDQMMRALLEAGDCCWQEDNGLIRVRSKETRTFAVNYLRLKRTGTGNSSATLNPASSGGSGGSSGGGSSSGGSGGSGGGGGGGSSVNLTADNTTDFWTELRSELGFILTAEGMKSLAINKTAGIIEITDRPSALERAEHYLNATEESINRQVDIETKIYDVTLNNAFQFGIDWNHVAEAYQGSLGFGTATLPTAIGSGSTLGNSALGGINTSSTSSSAGTAANTLMFQNLNTSAAVTALQTQGSVTVVAAPRIRTLNNQTALVKVGQELPFFSVSTINSQSSSGNQVSSGDTITTVTIGTILSITPQISEDGWIAMDISPVLTSLVQVETSPDKTATAPQLTDKQASTLVRVRNGTTVVLGGLIQTEKDESANSVPVLGEIPLLGKLFSGNYNAMTKNELVIFVTPHIVEAGESSVKYVNPPEKSKAKGN